MLSNAKLESAVRELNSTKHRLEKQLELQRQQSQDDSAQLRVDADEKVATLETSLQEARLQAVKAQTDNAAKIEHFESEVSELLADKAKIENKLDAALKHAADASTSMEADAEQRQQRIMDLQRSMEDERARYAQLKNESETATALWSGLVEAHSKVSSCWH